MSAQTTHEREKRLPQIEVTVRIDTRKQGNHAHPKSAEEDVTRAALPLRPRVCCFDPFVRIGASVCGGRPSRKRTSSWISIAQLPATAMTKSLHGATRVIPPRQRLPQQHSLPPFASRCTLAVAPWPDGHPLHRTLATAGRNDTVN